MNKNFLNNFYGVLFTPEKTFEEIKETQPLMSAVLIVIFVSMLKVFLYSNFKTLNSPFLYGSNLFMAAFSGIISWLFYAGFFELVAKIFDKGGKYKTFLILSALALLPWIFLGPVEMYKMLNFSGTAGGVLLGMLVWIWVVSLQIYALSKTYELSIGKTVLFILIPSLGWFVFLNWLVGFFTTLSHIL